MFYGSLFHSVINSEYVYSNITIKNRKYESKMQRGNDSFIFTSGKNFPTCKYDNQVLGRLIWLWIKKHANGVN